MDLARICAMCGIIALHILGRGGVLDASQENPAKHCIAWWLEICAYSSVDLFALLSGWLGIEKKHYSCYRIIELIAVVVTYSAVITGLFFVVNPGVFSSGKDVIKSLVPSLDGRYWYITCYIPLAFLQPYINKMLLSLSVQNHKKLCMVCVVFFSLMPSITKVDLFRFSDGYSFAWLAVCYTIGAYLKREKNGKNHMVARKGTCMLIFLVCSAILAAGQAVYYAIFHRDTDYMITYCSPFILLMAIAVIRFAADAEMKVGGQLFAKMSSAAFDVYVIHCHILIFELVIGDHFQWISNMPAVLIPAVVIGLVVGLYITLGIVGICRCVLFEKICLNGLLRKLSAIIDRKLVLRPTTGEN